MTRALELFNRLYETWMLALGAFASLLIVIVIYQRLQEKAASRRRKPP